MEELENLLKPEDKAKLLQYRESALKEETIPEGKKIDLDNEIPVGSASVHIDDSGNLAVYSNEKTQKILIEDKVVNQIKLGDENLRVGSKIHINNKEEIQIDGIATDGNDNLVYYRTIKKSPMGDVKISDSKKEGDFIQMLSSKNGVLIKDFTTKPRGEKTKKPISNEQHGSGNEQPKDDTITGMVKETPKIEPVVEETKNDEVKIESGLNKEEADLQASVYKLVEEHKKYLQEKVDKSKNDKDKVTASKRLTMFNKSPYQNLGENLEYSIEDLKQKIASEKIKGKKASLEKILKENEKNLQIIKDTFEKRVPLKSPDLNIKGVVFQNGKFVNERNSSGMLFKINRYLKSNENEYEILDTVQKGKTKYVTFKNGAGKTFEVNSTTLADMVKAEELYQIKGGAKVEIKNGNKKIIYNIISKDKDKVVFTEEGSNIKQSTTLEKMREFLSAKGVSFDIISEGFKKIKFGDKNKEKEIKKSDSTPISHTLKTPDGSVYNLKDLNEKQVELFKAILSDIETNQISREEIIALNERMDDEIKLPENTLSDLLNTYDKKNADKKGEENKDSENDNEAILAQKKKELEDVRKERDTLMANYNARAKARDEEIKKLEDELKKIEEGEKKTSIPEKESPMREERIEELKRLGIEFTQEIENGEIVIYIKSQNKKEFYKNGKFNGFEPINK